MIPCRHPPPVFILIVLKAINYTSWSTSNPTIHYGLQERDVLMCADDFLRRGCIGNHDYGQCQLSTSRRKPARAAKQVLVHSDYYLIRK